MSYETEIAAAASAHSLDARLVTAIVQQESAGKTDAFRFEPLFWARYLAKLPDYKNADPRRVSSSYGLMQLMYVTAKELGYAQEPEYLFVPSIGLEWGCRRVEALVAWAGTFPGTTNLQRLRAVLASYNGGKGGNPPDAALLRNGRYADQVLARLGTEFVARLG